LPDAKTAKGGIPRGKTLFGCLDFRHCGVALYCSSDTACAWQLESTGFVLVAGLKSLSGRLQGWPKPGILLKLLLFPLLPF
jgi:hypothetical protein